MKKQPALTYDEAERERIASESLRNKLKLISINTRRDLIEKHPHVNKFFSAKNFDLGKIRERSAKLLSAGALAGALFLTPPSEDFKFLPTPGEVVEKFNRDSLTDTNSDKKKMLVDTFSSVLPRSPRPLNRTEEKLLEHVFGQVLGVSTKANLEGEHLNTTFGYIGAEQHLRRFPGDNMYLQNVSKEIADEGMAPGLGAWGYFAHSKNELTKDLEEKEKWYAVVQTLYLPDWQRRQPYLKDWYKYRKVLIVNTQNGNAVIAVVADSGPAAWTGKQFGGSPEVMNELGGLKYKKGEVIIFFVDDPDNKVALGPVKYI